MSGAICGDRGPHAAHDTGFYGPGYPRHHGGRPVRCPGIAADPVIRHFDSEYHLAAALIDAGFPPLEAERTAIHIWGQHDPEAGRFLHVAIAEAIEELRTQERALKRQLGALLAVWQDCPAPPPDETRAQTP